MTDTEPPAMAEILLEVMAQRDQLRTALATATRHLDALCHENYEHRYEKDRPCSGCYQAVIDAQTALAGAPQPAEETRPA